MPVTVGLIALMYWWPYELALLLPLAFLSFLGTFILAGRLFRQRAT